MATITVHPEHLDGFADLLRVHFEIACEGQDPAILREVIALRDRFGWDAEDLAPFDPALRDSDGHAHLDATGTVTISEGLLNRFVDYAWDAGNSRLADVYRQRETHGPGTVEKDMETTARSMLAFHEHMQGQKVAS